MLLKNFYKVESLKNIDEGKYSAVVMLNKEHDIFKGHFPGNPVTPGVCMMQIVKELAEEITSVPLMLVQAVNVKFMVIINPEKNPELRLDLEVTDGNDAEVKVKNTTYFDDTVALKLSNVYKKIIS